VPLTSAAKATYLVGGDEDAWQPNGLAEDFGKPLGLDSLVIPGAGHIIIETGFGPWAGLVNWVNDPASDLSVR
jgi:predicted alpha/beta hydrolase family esterase